jgi:hypothetical protein
MLVERRQQAVRFQVLSIAPGHLCPEASRGNVEVTQSALSQRLLRSPTCSRSRKTAPDQGVYVGLGRIELPRSALFSAIVASDYEASDRNDARTEAEGGRVVR